VSPAWGSPIAVQPCLGLGKLDAGGGLAPVVQENAGPKSRGGTLVAMTRYWRARSER
jgi:hypothetical protein